MRPFDGTLKQDLETAAKAIGWGEPLPKGHGRTVACSGSDAGAYPLTSTAIRVHADGSVTITDRQHGIGSGQPYGSAPDRRRGTWNSVRERQRGLFGYRDHAL